jgi:acyl-[acyl-carrier-protein]-phospholipid O-acyltransferase/long-chain-fatty-acid--[acyl-carrier-protein] ligase
MPQEIIEQMIANGLPHLWIPHLDGFRPVDSIPVLGTGKLDLAALKQKAQESEQSAGTK